MQRQRTFITLSAATAVLLGASVGSGTGAGATTAQSSSESVRESSVVVHDWERHAMRTIYAEAMQPIPIGMLYLGFTSLAMYDAVEEAHDEDGSAYAAAAVAAHGVLTEYFPTSRATLDGNLADSLADVPDGDAKTEGIDIGQDAADDMIESREDDGRGDTSIVYSRTPAPGVWQPPAGGAMLAPWLGFVDPLVLDDLVEADGPDPITSLAYAFDYEEVRRVGKATGADRTQAQTDTAIFFNANAVTMLSGGLLGYLDQHPMSLRKTARLFARMHGAMADALIANWRLKYEIGYWRPSQAIQGAATDGNAATLPEAGWTPLLPNPPYPEYLSGHATVTAPAIEVIRRTLGEATPLQLTSTTLPGPPRLYPTLLLIEYDSFNARIWGGLHFRDAMEDGYRLGHKTAAKVMREID